MKGKWSCLPQELALLLPDPCLVPQRDLQHALTELPPVHGRVHERLVPLGFQGLLHCFRPPLALIAEVEENKTELKKSEQFQTFTVYLQHSNTMLCM